jgi:phage tail protein X
MIYRTVQGDVLDQICLKHYGSAHIEAVYLTNPGLADYGPILPSGVLITLPEIAAPEPEQPTIRLWG